jgi:hypothetical protein
MMKEDERPWPFYFNLPSGAGTATILLPGGATVEDVKRLALFVYTDDERRLMVCQAGEMLAAGRRARALADAERSAPADDFPIVRGIRAAMPRVAEE